jgi:hypothetical protein
MTEGEVMEATPEMLAWFEERTRQHIERVKKYADKIERRWIYRYFGLMKQTENHDLSKYQEPERSPYVFITWQYKCKESGKPFKISQEIQDSMNSATCHHVLHNRHHPEFHSTETVDLISREDRDKPSGKLIDATLMPLLDLAEMCADWMSIAEERGTSVKEWADKNVNTRWKFNPEQVERIYEIISEIKVDNELYSALGLSRFSRLGHF